MTTSARRAHAGEKHEVPDEVGAPRVVLFEGDRGGLPDPVRRVVVQLLRGPYVSRDRHPKAWPALVAAEAVVRERLGDLYCDLVVDHDRGVAFIRNVDAGDADVPKVVRTRSLSLLDTALLLHLRELLLRSVTDRTFVGRDEIDEQLALYRPAAATDEASFARRVNSTVSNLKEASILLGAAEEGRFEISPVLPLVFGIDEVRAVTVELHRLAGTGVEPDAAPGEIDPASRTDTDPDPADLGTAASDDLEGTL